MIKSARYLTVTTATTWLAIRLPKNKVSFIGLLPLVCCVPICYERYTHK
jgi:hypothetical protein